MTTNNWPEQDAVLAWIAKYQLTFSPEEIHDLIHAVTEYRLKIQRERELAFNIIKTAMECVQNPETAQEFSLATPQTAIANQFQEDLEGQGPKFRRDSPDPRPFDCRFRAQEEGRAYPRSVCHACGRTIASGLGSRCHVETQHMEQG